MLGVTETRDFYHLVESASPTRDDFRSYAERGMPYDREDPEACEMATGVSVNAILAQARSRARVVASLKKYRFVAVLRIPVDGSTRSSGLGASAATIPCGLIRKSWQTASSRSCRWMQ